MFGLIFNSQVFFRNFPGLRILLQPAKQPVFTAGVFQGNPGNLPAFAAIQKTQAEQVVFNKTKKRRKIQLYKTGPPAALKVLAGAKFGIVAAFAVVIVNVFYGAVMYMPGELCNYSIFVRSLQKDCAL